MDPDISIWRKTGHFYFALTRIRQLLINAYRTNSYWHFWNWIRKLLSV
jgi:hypothetical protein